MDHHNMRSPETSSIESMFFATQGCDTLPEMERSTSGSDLQFALDFRAIVERYIRALDSWETAYQKNYTLGRRGSERSLPADLDAANSEYIAARKVFKSALPRANRIAYKYNLRAPYQALLKVELGVNAVQFQQGSAIGRNERLAITECLMDMLTCCQDEASKAAGSENDSEAKPRKGLRTLRSIRQRIENYFL